MKSKTTYSIQEIRDLTGYTERRIRQLRNHDDKTLPNRLIPKIDYFYDYGKGCIVYTQKGLEKLKKK